MRRPRLFLTTTTPGWSASVASLCALAALAVVLVAFVAAMRKLEQRGVAPLTPAVRDPGDAALTFIIHLEPGRRTVLDGGRTLPFSASEVHAIARGRGITDPGRVRFDIVVHPGVTAGDIVDVTDELRRLGYENVSLASR